MEPLITEIDKKKTLDKVEKHLQSLSLITHMISIENSNEIEINQSSYIIKKKELPSNNKIMRDMNKVDYHNAKTQQYLEWIIIKVNELNPYERKLILAKYFYGMDQEELEQYIGFSYRKINEDMQYTKIKLAYLMRCEIYSEQ